MAFEDEKAASTLGERLLAGVTNLWMEVKRLGKVLDHHGQEIEALKARMLTLERETKGLRIARGKAKAKSARLEAALVESETKLAEIKAVLH
ncbi:MAG: hypothetical protein ACM3JG_02585 [Thiohalocapsa sp.]